MGHEQADTTQIYLHADLELKEKALAKTTPANTKPGRYQPQDSSYETALSSSCRSPGG